MRLVASACNWLIVAAFIAFQITQYSLIEERTDQLEVLRETAEELLYEGAIKGFKPDSGISSDGYNPEWSETRISLMKKVAVTPFAFLSGVECLLRAYTLYPSLNYTLQVDLDYYRVHGCSRMVEVVIEHNQQDLNSNSLQKQLFKELSSLQGWDFDEPEKTEFCVMVIAQNTRQAKTLKRNLDSILNQEYKKMQVVVIDDGSTDESLEAIELYLSKHPNFTNRFFTQRNEQPMHSLWNHYHYIPKHCRPSSVVVPINGHDYLLGTNVFKLLDAVFRNDSVWFAYTLQKSSEAFKIYNEPITAEDIGRRDLERAKVSNLVAFRQKLFLKLNEADLKEKQTSNFYGDGGNLLSISLMLELAGKEHIKFIPHLCYQYSDPFIRLADKAAEELYNFKKISRVQTYNSLSSLN